MKIIYKPILNIEIWHDYYLGQPELPQSLPVDYDISDLLTLVPTTDCLQTLRNSRWISRSRPSGLAIFAEVEAVTPGHSALDYQTKIAVNRSYRLTFWLKISDPNFANFTNLPLTRNPNQIFYFSNRSGNNQTYSFPNNEGQIENINNLFLSQTLPTYSSGNEYVLGELVTHNNNTLESLNYQASAEAVPASEQWDTFPPSQYVSAQDQLLRQGLTRPHIIAAANPGEIFRFTLTDINQQTPFVKEITVPESHPEGNSISVSLNFTGQPPGRYRLDLNGDQIDEFVLFDSLRTPSRFALVEIVLDPTDISDFAPLQTEDNQTLIQPRQYIIRFKNRSTRWRYYTQFSRPLTDDELEEMELEQIGTQTYATIRPKGLRQKPNLPPLNDSRRLPDPSVAQIQPEINSDQRITQVFSDIYL